MAPPPPASSRRIVPLAALAWSHCLERWIQVGRREVSRPAEGSRFAGQDKDGVVRGRYLTLHQASEAFPAFSPRLLRRLVQERRIPFSRAGRCIVIAEADIHAYLERNRVEPPRWDVAS